MTVKCKITKNIFLRTSFRKVYFCFSLAYKMYLILDHGFSECEGCV